MMEKAEPGSPLTGVTRPEDANGSVDVDVEKEMPGHDQPGVSETASSSTTLSGPADDTDEEKDISGPLPSINNDLNLLSRPELERTATSNVSMAQSLPRLQHLGITLGLPAILVFDIVVPCIIYYTWYNSHRDDWEKQCHEEYHSLPRDCPLPKPEFDEDILGYAIISFGFGELWILIARVFRLFCHREDCAPLLSRNRWELDATSWVYAVAMIMALIPFVVASSLGLPHLYLYSPAFLMGFLGILMVITTSYPFKIPIGINSHPRGSKLRPFIYYAAEDFIAVDGLQDREFRVRYNDRYEANKAFRRMFLHLTWWWIFGVCVYFGAVSAVIWTLEFHYAFGLSLGVLFSYITVWAAVSYVWVKVEIEREHRVFEEGKFDP